MSSEASRRFTEAAWFWRAEIKLPNLRLSDAALDVQFSAADLVLDFRSGPERDGGGSFSLLRQTCGGALGLPVPRRILRKASCEQWMHPKQVAMSVN